MNEILEKDVATEINIINIITSKKEWCSVEELSTKLGIGSRTVYKYLKIIKDDLICTEVSGKKVGKLVFSKGRGFKIDSGERNNIRAIRGIIYKKSLVISLLLTLAKDHRRSVRTLALENYTSESTIRRSLNSIKQLSKKWGVNISQGSEVRLLGSERQIRIFLITTLWGIYKGYDYELLNKEKTEILLLLSLLEKIFIFL